MSIIVSTEHSEPGIELILFQLFHSESNYSDSRVNLIIVDAVAIILLTWQVSVSKWGQLSETFQHVIYITMTNADNSVGVFLLHQPTVVESRLTVCYIY